MSEVTYKSAGVNLDAAEVATRAIIKLAKSTYTPGVIREVGLFGGFFQPDLAGYKQPVLVSSVDGVGTKLKIAFQTGRHDTIGEDLVNHCVNDIMTGGAKPLFFLDYVGTGVLEPNVIENIVAGLARGCKNANCALIGGETAEMPGFYPAGEYDIAGTIVGIVDREKIIDGSTVKKGDIMLGLPSSGLHTNGYSLARKVLLENKGYTLDEEIKEVGHSLGDELLRVHRSYQQLISTLLDKPYLTAMSHITGGGIVGNTERVVPKHLKLQIFWENWEVPPIFKLIQRAGKISDEEMRRVFNMGIGYIFIVHREGVEDAISRLNEFEDFVYIVGEIHA
jgi:phosphoribosylformylglycinamidine cyclo-ligase